MFIGLQLISLPSGTRFFRMAVNFSFFLAMITKTQSCSLVLLPFRNSTVHVCM